MSLFVCANSFQQHCVQVQVPLLCVCVRTHVFMKECVRMRVFDWLCCAYSRDKELCEFNIL